VGLNEQAQADLRRMPLPVARCVLQSLRRLETNPEGESRPTSGLHASGFVFELEYALGDLDFYIDVLFRYGPGESQITVFQLLWEYV
jgi:hypothetical protein